MSRHNRAFGIYIFLIILVAVFLILRTTGTAWQSGQSYTEVALEKDLKEGKVAAVFIEPNHEVPSGEVQVTMSDGKDMRLYTADVNEVVRILRENNFKDYRQADVPGENWLISLLPMLLVFGVVFIFYIMMTSQAQANTGGAKMMNFGKSRAKMTTEENKKISFGNVAGLREEKEDLEEIVDFLKYPDRKSVV